MDGGKRHEQRGTIMIVVRQRRHVLTSTPHGTASLLCPTYIISSLKSPFCPFPFIWIWSQPVKIQAYILLKIIFFYISYRFIH
jgi:hypothetical protein